MTSVRVAIHAEVAPPTASARHPEASSFRPSRWRPIDAVTVAISPSTASLSVPTAQASALALSGEAIEQSSRERESHVAEQEPRKMIECPLADVGSRRRAAPHEGEGKEHRREQNDARRLRCRGHRPSGFAHLLAYGDGAGQIVDRETAPEPCVRAVEAQDDSDGMESDQRDDAKQEHRADSDALLFAPGTDHGRYRVHRRCAADHRAARQQVGEWAAYAERCGNGVGDEERAGHAGCRNDTE